MQEVVAVLAGGGSAQRLFELQVDAENTLLGFFVGDAAAHDGKRQCGCGEGEEDEDCEGSGHQYFRFRPGGLLIIDQTSWTISKESDYVSNNCNRNVAECDAQEFAVFAWEEGREV